MSHKRIYRAAPAASSIELSGDDDTLRTTEGAEKLLMD